MWQPQQPWYVDVFMYLAGVAIIAFFCGYLDFKLGG